MEHDVVKLDDVGHHGVDARPVVSKEVAKSEEMRHYKS